MSSTLSSAANKPVSAPVATNNHSNPPSQSAAAPFEANRRQTPTQSPLHSQAAPRKGQSARKQHRGQRKTGTMNNSNHIDEEDSMAESRVLRNASSRRGQMSITHLMSYALPPRPQAESRPYRRNPPWVVGSGYHVTDKARYIHANYRFVVNPGGDYSAQAADADRFLEWSDVLQVLASAESQQTSCPICLSEPVAPRMAQCGHIFCLPCLIRFMNSVIGDSTGPETKKPQNKWRKCPICEDTVYIAETRPVRFYAGQEGRHPRPGDDVVLRLMVRKYNGTLALPKEGGAEVVHSDNEIPWHFAANVLEYARIMRGTGGYMTEEFDREVEDLLRQEKEDELIFHEDPEWTQKAIKAIKAEREKMVGLGDAQVAAALASPANSELGRRQREHDFMFYTAPPHLYLSSLDNRILRANFGDYSAWPSTLLPRVEHVSTGHSVDDFLRKRTKYLGHLPRGCLVSFLECDWTDIIPPEVLAEFAGEIEARRKRHWDQAEREERQRLQAESNGRRQLGVVDEKVVVRFGNAGVEQEESRVNMDDFVPLGATPPNPRTGFGSLSDISTSPSGRRTVWGTPLVAGASEETVVPASRPIDDGWLRDDDVLESLDAASISMQLEAMGIESSGSSSGTASKAAASVGGGKKKKKKEKITLMSTGGRRGF